MYTSDKKVNCPSLSFHDKGKNRFKIFLCALKQYCLTYMPGIGSNPLPAFP